IALLQTLGVNHSQLVNMKIFEESISLLTMSLIAFSLSTVLTLLFASQLLEMFPIFILVILINAAILLIINLIIYILFLKRYTPEFLLK
ncbi:2-dehydro-3-deoxygalactonokinase, partial [Coprobacillus cateniformis]|nr:2-dehydro-3-deoxygalactonokinase [Coprobacillus cateniformis]